MEDQQKTAEIILLYEDGFSLTSIKRMRPDWGVMEIRAALNGRIRIKRVSYLPSADEVGQRAAAVRASWSPEQTASRWVGRYCRRAIEDRGQIWGPCLRSIARTEGE